MAPDTLARERQQRRGVDFEEVRLVLVIADRHLRRQRLARARHLPNAPATPVSVSVSSSADGDFAAERRHRAS
jgi:hypothetical protein